MSIFAKLQVEHDESDALHKSYCLISYAHFVMNNNVNLRPNVTAAHTQPFFLKQGEIKFQTC